MNIRKTSRSVSLLVAVCAALPICGQDLMVNTLPIDNKLRAIDSISIVNMQMLEAGMGGDPTMLNLYPSWTNTYERYNTKLPQEYRIDLSHFCMPCDSRLVTSHYGYRPKFKRNHYGTDIKVYVGDTIRAAFDGKVRVVDYEGKGYGKYVMIRHANGLETLYGHMSKQLVKANQMVKAGDPIGLGGSTGRSTGSHLHFETRFLGEFINPEILFSFEAHDAKADAYVFHPNGKGVLSGSHNMVGGEDLAAAKVAESQQFQQEKTQRASRSQIHKVKKGETLSSIAKKYHTTVDKLCQLNKISKNKTLRTGQILKCS